MIRKILRLLRWITDTLDRINGDEKPSVIVIPQDPKRTEQIGTKPADTIGFSKSDLISPLKDVENHFLEVLITYFILERHNQGCELIVYFDDKTLTIWNRHAKEQVEQSIPDFNKKAFYYQKELDAFLLHGEKALYKFNDPIFPFRYASGGALPIIKLGKKQYYCLFYRDISPIGWNIANGGCDTRNELLYPLDTIERELREELIIINKEKENKTRFVFPGDMGKPLDHPDFEIARRFWSERFDDLNISEFKEKPIDITWIKGPDAVIVNTVDFPTKKIEGVFLNINAQDFGIEVDRIAAIKLEQNVTLLDGEISQNLLINRLVGLFNIERMSEKFINKNAEFIPDDFFYDGERYDGKLLKEIINERFLTHVATLRTEQEKKQYENTRIKYDLCPVTRSILRRYLRMRRENSSK